MTKPNKPTAIEKLSTTLRAKSSAWERVTHGHGGSHIIFSSFNTSGLLHGITGFGMRLYNNIKIYKNI